MEIAAKITLFLCIRPGLNFTCAEYNTYTNTIGIQYLFLARDLLYIFNMFNPGYGPSIFLLIFESTRIRKFGISFKTSHLIESHRITFNFK